MLGNWAEKNATRLPLVLGAILITLTSAGLALAVSFKAPPPPASERISDTATLIMVGNDGCSWCVKFQDVLGPQYKRSPYQAKAPLKYMDTADYQDQKRYQFKSGISGTPTTVMFDTYGREVGRMVGYPGDLAKLTNKVDGLMKYAKLPVE